MGLHELKKDFPHRHTRDNDIQFTDTTAYAAFTMSSLSPQHMAVVAVCHV